MSDKKNLTPTEILTAESDKTSTVVVNFLTGDGFPEGMIAKSK